MFNTSAHVISGENVHAYEARQEAVDYLRASGPPSVRIRPTFDYEIFLGPRIRPGIVDSGVVAFPLPAQFLMSWISAEKRPRTQWPPWTVQTWPGRNSM